MGGLQLFQRVFLVTASMFCLVSTMEHAQAIDKTEKHRTERSRSTDPALIDTLKTYAAANTAFPYAEEACSIILNNSRVQRTEADFKLGNYIIASAGYLLLAEHVAQCAVGPSRTGRVARIPLPMAIDKVGAFLSLSVIAAHAGGGGLDTAQTVSSANDALRLLNINRVANEQLIGMVRETGLVGDKTPAMAPSNAESISMTAKDAISEYKSNSFAFQSKYDGKPLTISGTVLSIGGSGQQATLSLVGHMPSDLDKMGWQDEVQCHVSDPASLARVMNLKIGDTAKVTGLFKPKQSFQIGIELQKCQPN